MSHFLFYRLPYFLAAGFACCLLDSLRYLPLIRSSITQAAPIEKRKFRPLSFPDASTTLLQPDIRIPIPEPSVLIWLPLCNHKVRKAKHRSHVFLIAEIVPRHAQKIAWLTLRIVQTGQDQVPMVIVTMKQKAVVPIHPDLPRKEPDILRLDGKDLTTLIIIKRQHSCIAALHPLPVPIWPGFLLLLPFQLGQTSGIFQFWKIVRCLLS